MCSRTILVEPMLCDGLVVFSFEKHLQSFLLVVSLPAGETLYENVALLVFLDIELGTVGLIQQIHQSLIVEFQVGDGHLDLVFVAGVNLLEERGNESGHDAPVFIIGLRTSHREGLACSSLSVTEDAAGVSLEGSREYLLGAEVIDHFLRGIREHLFVLEAPLVLLVVDDTRFGRALHVY